jgi:hypothetical protein
LNREDAKARSGRGWSGFEQTQINKNRHGRHKGGHDDQRMMDNRRDLFAPSRLRG